MKYLYKCDNPECKKHDEEITRDVPMMNASDPQECEQCRHTLTRIYQTGMVKGFNPHEKAKY